MKIRNLLLDLTSWDKQETGCKPTTSFKVHSLDGSLTLEIDDGIVGGFVASPEEIPLKNEITKKFEFMKDVEVHDLEDNNVELLIGSKFIRHYMGKESRMGKPDEPIAIHTDFGWAIAGPIPDSDEFHPEIAQLGVSQIELENLDALIRQMYRHDFLSRPGEDFPSEYRHNSQFDEYTIEQIRETIKFDKKEKRYSVGLPWKHGREKTRQVFEQTDFRSYALNRTHRLKRKLEKDKTLLDGSFAQVQENLDNGYSKIITDESAPPESPVCYLANHIALHDEKPGKFRVCQDAAGKVNGKCLNDFLLTGPDVMNALFGIILRFRQHQVVLSADVKDFFYRILMDKKDRSAARFFWWKDKSMEEIIVIETMCHLFGLASSPSISNLILQYHGSKIKEKYGLDIFICILLYFYVDDFLSSIKNVKRAKEIKEKLTDALAIGGFVLTKWKSNFPELNDPTPPSSLSQQTQPESSVEPMEKGEADRSESPRSSQPPTQNPSESEDDDDEDYDLTEEELTEKINNSFATGEESMEEFTKDLGNKILGVGYSYENDTLYVRVREKLFKPVNTKSQLLSWIASIYDPLGFVGPYVLVGRILFQELQQLKLGWKDPVPENFKKDFEKWRKNVLQLRKLTIPRWTSSLAMEDSVSRLIIFCDASAKGYGAVAYVRRNVRGNESNCLVSFLVSKSHVVPLSMSVKKLDRQECHGDSIPRLELQGAQLAAQIRDAIVRNSNETYDEIIMFTDSLTVRGWIRCWRRKYKTFENFRLLRIRNLSNEIEWRHVPTLMNPADIASKGCRAEDKKKWDFFHNGPNFIHLPPQDWPEEADSNGKDVEQEKISKTISAMAMVTPVELLMLGATKDEPALYNSQDKEPWPITRTEKLSCWQTKVRRVAYIVKTFPWYLKFLKDRAILKKSEGPVDANNEIIDVPGHRYPLRSKRKIVSETKNTTENRQIEGAPKNNKVQCFLNLNEKTKAEQLLVKAIQAKHFHNELATLLKLGVFEPDSYAESNLKTKDSKLITLSPFIDEEGILRVGGRLGKSTTLSFDTKHPIILPNSDSEIIQSLIRHVHHRNYHCSQTETFYLLRQKYYLLGGRNTVKKVVSRCIQCQKATKLPLTQKMAPLPEERSSMAIPFSTSGIDVFGDFKTKVGRYEKKRWVLIVTCFSTRAVALFPLADMTLDSVILALIKMQSQYPTLKKIVSDNGSNFKGASRELREARESWNEQEAVEKLSDHGIDWTFGPAYCGSWGGVWERLIGLIKNSFRASMNGRKLNVEQFDAMCAGVTGVINRRPLTRPENWKDGMIVMSPSNLLFPYNHSSSSSFLPPITDRGDALRSTWKAVQKNLDDFWKEWHRSYITHLTERKKWAKSTPPLKLDDVVLVKAPIQPRENWRIGRIVEIVSGDEEHARTYRLADAYGNVFTRHRTSLILLELY